MFLSCLKARCELLNRLVQCSYSRMCLSLLFAFGCISLQAIYGFASFHFWHSKFWTCSASLPESCVGKKVGLKKTFLQWFSVKFSRISDCGFLLSRLSASFLVHFIVCLPCVFSEVKCIVPGIFELEDSDLFCGHMNSVLAAQ